MADEVNGTWGKARKVPGLAALSLSGDSAVNSVACASAGNCSAGGEYATGGSDQAFVAAEVNGTWHRAKEAPGTAALNRGGDATINSVSCASAGNCSAGGLYASSSTAQGGLMQQAFVISQVNGTWHRAKEVPGTAALNQGADANAGVISVSCSAPGTCGAGGIYTDSSSHLQAFVASQTHGTWTTAAEVPGTAALNQGGYANVVTLSCTGTGSCSAGGNYFDSSRHEQAFVADETGGTWGTAEQVPGTMALSQGGQTALTGASCTSAGNCSAGGWYYNNATSTGGAFVASETDGTWGTAQQIPGMAEIDSLSCDSAGNCSAGGTGIVAGQQQAFVVNEADGTWGTAEEVPGIAALNHGGSATIKSVSCTPPGNCSAGGYYLNNAGRQHAFVVDETTSIQRR